MSEQVRKISLAEQIRAVEAAWRIVTGRERAPARAVEREYAGDVLAQALASLRWLKAHEGDVRAAVARAPAAVAAPSVDAAPAAERGKPCEFPIARRAAMRCAEGGFQRFLGAADADGAAAELRRRCGVASRKDFDRDEGARGRWRALEADYAAWLRCADEGGGES
ncbi:MULTISPECIES: hypothetical protein [Methylosinus]|uniref:Uncharacterized protein n=1 Tax=Methylosinus trichosporium (strain ATCC 35070 / NCIMB 11131 / UNIQEM 75 / OB3b) TaxID=595536 RepID=A0A2D2CYM6_METT3|nr:MULTISPECIES: hypothetical protein [Methylosinus]ATQ67749.1 hypothetical protein CQW49_07470 [Methylosinus trichosporium OB3b]OBS51144.1 hypothetical protein A8B73_17635 [Methylosinus sp. 3S-1]